MSLHSLQAEEHWPEIHISLQQTFIKSEKNDFVIPDSSEGSFEFAEVDINASKYFLDDRIYIGAQVVSLDFGQEGNFKTRLDWAYGRYSVNEKLNISAGKVRPSSGLHSRDRHIDASRVPLLPNQAYYPEYIRSFGSGITGIQLGGYFDLSRYGGLTYDIIYGSMDISEENYAVTNLRQQLSSPTSMFDVNSLVIDLRWSSPNSTYLLGSTLSHVRGDISYANPLIDDPKAFDNTTNVLGYYCKYQKRKHTLTIEYSFAPQKWASSEQLRSFGFPDYLVNEARESAYIQHEYQWNETWAHYMSYSIARKDKDDYHSQEKQRKGFALGIRHDVNDFWIIKLEQHFFRGTYEVIGDGNDNSWSMFLARTSFSW
ncbi:MAG: hypothetical protein HQL32_05890 [Planctomycetes bacterium]|nr:hypothetical protein [Planctomycetota bacterium]